MGRTTPYFGRVGHSRRRDSEPRGKADQVGDRPGLHLPHHVPPLFLAMNPTDVMSLRRLSPSPALGSFEEVGGRGGERATKYSQEYATSGHGRRPGLLAFLPKRKDPRSLRRGVVVGTIESEGAFERIPTTGIRAPSHRFARTRRRVAATAANTRRRSRSAASWSAATARRAGSRTAAGTSRIDDGDEIRGRRRKPEMSDRRSHGRLNNPLRRSMNPMRIVDSLSRRSLRATLIIGLVLATGSLSAAREAQPTTTKPTCAADNGGITLPAGFCATVFADNIGHARHLVVAPNGVVYVNTWNGPYYGNDTPPAGAFLVGLLDSTGDGRADVKLRFGDSVQTGGARGAGIQPHPGRAFVVAGGPAPRVAPAP